MISHNSGQPEWRSLPCKTLSLSEAKMKLSSLIDTIQSTDEECSSRRMEPPAASWSVRDEFESLKETIAVRSDAALMREIKEGLMDLKRRKARLYTLEEIFE